MKLARSNAIISIPTDEDLTGKEGQFIRMSSNTAIALIDAATVIPLGLLLTEGIVGDQVSIALSAGGLAGTVRVKLAGTVYIGSRLQLTADGRVIEDLGELARVIVGVAVEGGVAGEYVEAVLCNPVSYAS